MPAFVLVALLLGAEPPAEAAGSPAPLPALYGALEGGLGALEQDAFLTVRPLVGVSFGDPFTLEVGADLRLRVVDAPPLKAQPDYGGFLRREDWDELSDYGQLIQALRAGQPESLVWLEAGPARKKTLGLGHLVGRYSNQDNPNYHPAAATLAARYKAVRGELFASDVLGYRLFALEVVLDVGRVVVTSEDGWDRFHAAVSFAHDGSRTGGVGSPVTLFHLDLDALLYRGQTVRFTVLAGAGARAPDAIDPTADVGLLGGAAADAVFDNGFALGGKVELRKQGGGFRQAFFGPGYELARYAGAGFSGPSRAAEQVPDGFSLAVDLRAAAGQVVSVDLSAEHFPAWARTDLDAVVSVELVDHRVTASARFTAVGLLVQPRYAVGAEARVRLAASVYALGSGGTVFFPQPDGTLARGFFFSAGVGIDFER